MKTYIIGTRGSLLALKQVEEVIKELKKNNIKINYFVECINTKGDKDKKTPLTKVKDDDFFTYEIDEALKNKKIDVAIHSAKDLPVKIDEKLCIAAITKGKSNGDVLLFKKNKVYKTIYDLPEGFKIGTSSINRITGIKKLRKDLKLIPIRGNIDERIKKISNNLIDGLIIAKAAIERLKMKDFEYIKLPIITHPLQGRLAVVVRKEDDELIDLFKKIDDRKNWGKIYFVGAGTNRELLTIKGIKCLKKADIVFYDKLVDNSLINFLSKNFVCVGKRKGEKSLAPEEIGNLMVKKAYSGKNVVRLKSGCVSIFSRLFEELDFVKKSLIDYEIVPGVNSASSASAYTEIPLTDRRFSSATLFLAGHPLNKIYIPSVDYNGTIVFFMASSNLKNILYKFISNGWGEDTRIAIISNVSKYNQKVIITTFKEAIKIKKISQPAIIIIGKFINDKNKAWFEKKDKLLFTGTDISEYEKYGEIEWIKCINLIKRDNNIKKKDILWATDIIFTSKYGVKFFMEELFEQKLDARILYNKNIISIGPKTSLTLKEFGILPDIEAKESLTKGLIKIIEKLNLKNRKFLLPRSSIANDILPKHLKQKGNHVKQIKLYDNIFIPKILKKNIVNLNNFDKIVFTSPSTVKNFKKIYKQIPDKIKIITKGETTFKEYKKCFLNDIDL